MGASENVEILLTQEKRPEDAGVLAQPHARAIDEGEVGGLKLQAHGGVEGA